MIASVVVKFSSECSESDVIREQIVARPGMEVGERSGFHSLPVVIEAENPEAMEVQTRWLQSLPGVAFVDVVFVHLENENQAV